MAGFIHIKDNTGFPVNSVAFNAIVEFSRGFFNEEDRYLVREVYSPIDEGGMDMVSLDEEGREGFNAFYRGIKAAYDSCYESGRCGDLEMQYFSSVMESWEELLGLLESDKRFVAQ